VEQHFPWIQTKLASAVTELESLLNMSSEDVCSLLNLCVQEQ